MERDNEGDLIDPAKWLFENYSLLQLKSYYLWNHSTPEEQEWIKGALELHRKDLKQKLNDSKRDKEASLQTETKSIPNKEDL